MTTTGGTCALGLGLARSVLFRYSNLPGFIAGRPGPAQRSLRRLRRCDRCLAVNPRAPTDGVWLLDYRSGKLMGTVIDRSAGKIVGWGESI